MSKRKQQTPQHSLVEHVQHVGLILGNIGTSADSRPIDRSDNTSMVSGGDHREAERVGTAQQTIELQVPIALDAWIRGPARRVVRHIRADHIAFEVVTEIEHMVLDAESVGDAASVINIGNCTTTRVTRPAPQFHGDAHHLVAGLQQQSGRDRGINPARHGNHDRSPMIQG